MNFLQRDSGIGCQMKMNNRVGYATLVLVRFTIMLPISTISRARAHDHQHPKLNGWYESLPGGKGPCCRWALTRSALMTLIGTLRTVIIACASMASGLMFRTRPSWIDRTALAARWSGLTTWMVTPRRAASGRGAWADRERQFPPTSSNSPDSVCCFG